MLVHVWPHRVGQLGPISLSRFNLVTRRPGHKCGTKYGNILSPVLLRRFKQVI